MRVPFDTIPNLFFKTLPNAAAFNKLVQRLPHPTMWYDVVKYHTGMNDDMRVPVMSYELAHLSTSS